MGTNIKTQPQYNHQPLVIPADDELKSILKDANLPTLMATILLYTGDWEIFKGYKKPNNDTFNDMNGGIIPDESDDIRQKALEALKSIRDGKSALAALPDEDQFYKLLNYLVGAEVPNEIRPMYWEEFQTAVSGKDARSIHWKNKPDPQQTNFKVLVIGAGASGLLAAIKLQEAGIDYVVIDRNKEIGGTWYENTYPGAGVDTVSAFYSFSFENNTEWPRYYAQRNDVFKYWNDCADKYGVRSNVKLQTEIQDLEWNENRKVWRAVVLNNEGAKETIEANAVFCGVGQLNKWKIPPFQNLDKYKGDAFHTANWQSDVDLTNKNVVLIGTGATSMQLAPTIADKVKKLTIVQKDAQWIIGTDYYGKSVPSGERYLLRNFPLFATLFRILAMFKGLDKFDDLYVMDPNRKDIFNSASPTNDQIRTLFTQYIKDKVGDDKDLFSKLVPTYPPFGTRILLDYGWIETLQKPNVHLFTGNIDSFTEDGILTSEGKLEADVVLFATGFTPLKFSFNVKGKGGVPITDDSVWGTNPSDPRANLGITIPGYPNLFLFYGPNTNIGTGCVPFNCELQVRYAMKSIQYLIENDLKSIECKKEAHDKYNEYVDTCLENLVYSHPKSNSWYNTGKKGRASTNMPFSAQHYWTLTKEPNLNDYDLV